MGIARAGSNPATIATRNNEICSFCIFTFFTFRGIRTVYHVRLVAEVVRRGDGVKKQMNGMRQR